MNDRFFSRERWVDGVRIVGGAIGVTIIGDLTLEVLTGEFSEWSVAGRWWRVVMYLVACLSIIGLWPAIAELLKPDPSTDLDLGSERDVQATAALIVTASAPENPSVGPHWTATNNFLQARDSPFKYLFILHSDDERCVKSVERLAGYATARGVAVRYKDFLANYDDLSDVYEKAELAIRLAVAEVKDPSQVTVDVTGGTKLSSVGVSMAMVEREDDIVLGHIPWELDEQTRKTVPGTRMRVVDLKWKRKDS